jgi:hypothetical protein
MHMPNPHRKPLHQLCSWSRYVPLHKDRGRARVYVCMYVRKGKAIPLQAWTGPEASRFQDNRHLKVVRLSALRTESPYPQAESTPGPYCGWKDYVNEKIPMTPSGIEPATIRLVAQCLNQPRHRVPSCMCVCVCVCVYIYIIHIPHLGCFL